MKKIYSIFLIAIASLFLAPAINAQTHTINDYIKSKYGSSATITFPKDNGVIVNEDKKVAYSKNVSSPFNDGVYYVKLETFATGQASYEMVAKPVDIVLVLDISSSMYETRGTTKDYYLDVAYNDNNVRNGTVFSYSSMNDTDYYYQVGDTRYPVRRERYPNQGTNRRYYLYYFEDANGNNTEDNGENRYYLNVDGTVVATPNQRPAGVTQQGGQLFSGTLVHYRTQQRIDALKQAVKDFIAVIDHNDQYDDDGNLRVDENNNPKRLGNRISIVTFASAEHVDAIVSLEEGVLGSGTAEGMEAKVDAMRLYSGTRQALGLDEAYNQFSNYVDADRKEEASRTVVLFTDGEPYFGNTSVNTLYDDGVVSAKNIKVDHTATVFTVGVFSSSPEANVDALWFFMQYMSSNAPNATGRTEPGENFNPDGGYYKDASDPNMDLSAVFTEIAHQSAAETTTLSKATSTVDVVSNSFILPEGADADHIKDYVKIFTAPLESITTSGGKTTYNFGTEIQQPYNNYQYDEDGNPVTSGGTDIDASIDIELEGTNGIRVTNFDYSKNWCGPVVDNTQTPPVTTYRGHKIIILIPIKMNPDAVGGPNCETNGTGSGIYVDDTALEQGDSFIEFKSPTVSLPVNMYLEKKGLTGVESVKFRIERAVLPLGYGDWTDEQKENYDPSTLTDWEFVSTVFVTNSENSKSNPNTGNPWVKVRGMPATKAVNGVQRDLIYRVSEEPWSWSYKDKLPAGVTVPEGKPYYQYTDTKHIENPFLFENETIDKRIDVTIRHAESKVTNHFKTGVTNEVYDDSKDNGR